MSGLKTFIGLILRRDKIKLPVWIALITTTLIAIVPLLSDVYGDEASLQALSQTFGLNPAGLFLTGPIDSPTLGALMTMETVLWWGMAIAFMNTLLVVRHTRHNEEIGAQELLLSGQVHRMAGLAAVLIVALVANLIMGLAIAVSMDLVSQAWSTNNAWLYGISFAVFGMAWAVIAAIVVQLVESARSANGLLAALIGLSFIVRGIGDFMGKPDSQGILQAAWISYLSPLGWLQATRSLTIPDWWPLVIPIVFSVVTILISFWLLSRRDVGAGLLPARIGKLRASKVLRTPLGLTWHLQKNIFIGWLAGIVAMVATLGVLAPDMGRVLESSDSMKTVVGAIGGTGELLPTFLSAMLAIIVLMVAAYAVHALGRLRSEESNGYLENILATSQSRTSWLMLHTLIVLILTIFMLGLAGFTMAALVNLVVDDANLDLWNYTLASWSYFPAIAIFIGGYTALFSLLPRAVSLVVWSYLGLVLFLQWLAPMLRLDDGIMNLSPFTHVAAAPAEAIKYSPLAIMLAISLLLLMVAVLAWRRRDLIEK